ncbi:MAG: amino acid permease [Cytophagales bacterium]|nr:amino acid permease [Cytophagales bacterium]
MSIFRKKSIQDILRQSEGHVLKRSLTYRDLVAFGISAIIGAGIFSTIGNAAAVGGPAISLLFVFTAVACVFSAMCYAQFSSSIPISGSAYTYAYHAFGELIAWIIGWDLLMEYAISNVVVAISWSDYFTSLVEGLGYQIPGWLTMDYLSASKAADMVSRGGPAVSESVNFAANAWKDAPEFMGFKIILDIPALFINAAVTWLVYIGISESKMASNIMVVIKLLVIGLVLGIGLFYVQPSHWIPFAPNGIGGVLKGVSAVFFAYIGFDAISTTAEECKDPKKDLPKAMITALIVCAIIYVAISLVITGMVDYKELAVGDPMAYVFQYYHLDFLSGLISASAVIAMTGVILVYQLAQPRIWMSMSRDGLLPKPFSRIHPKYKTPGFATIVMGFTVGLPVLFMNLSEVTDLSSIGTLFAFILICGGVLFMDNTPREGNHKAFMVPYINGKYFVPIVFGSIIFFWMFSSPRDFIISTMEWEIVKHKIPLYFFLLVSMVLCVVTFLKNLSSIPVAGLLINLYLMTELGWLNWLRFLVWLVIGLVIYFSFGLKNSRIGKETVQ